jgi:Tfp pilus assembly protein PilX
MRNNENGFVLPIILFLTTILSSWVIGSLPFFSTSHRMIENEWGKWQATSNAEAGIDLAIEEWENVNSVNEHSYSLVNGSAHVSITDLGETLNIISVGEASSGFQAVISVIYEKKSKKIVHWHGDG